MHAYGNVMHTSTYLQIIVNIPFKEESLQLIKCFAVVGDSNIHGQGDRQINNSSDINHIWSTW